jgi:glycosyltransferase involved in cell wall biosynthesis
MDKILTIIIPTYNMEKYLRHCLDSLIVPNMNKVEVLVINDGSKDSSSAIGHEYQNKYPQTFRVIDKENGNYGSCVNRGLKEATGKYVKVLDADDSFDTGNFKEYVDYLEKFDVDLVLNDFTQVTDEGKVLSKWTGHNLPTNSVFGFDKLGATCNMMMHAVAYKTEDIRNIPGGYHQTEGISYTDQEWIFLPMSTVKTIVYFDKILYKYLMGRDGQTVDKRNFLRNLWMEAEGEKNMINEYKLLSKGFSNIEYMQNRLIYRAFAIYVNYIIYHYPSEFNLQEYDKWLLKNAPKLQYYCENISLDAPKIGLHCPLVKLWKEGKLKYSMSYKIWYVYNKLRSIIKKSNKTYFDANK